jgi:hypothetical protein
MSRKQCPSPTDLHHVVKLPNDAWEDLGAAAMSRGMSRPHLALELLTVMLGNPEIIGLARIIAEWAIRTIMDATCRPWMALDLTSQMKS